MFMPWRHTCFSGATIVSGNHRRSCHFDSHIPRMNREFRFKMHFSDSTKDDKHASKNLIVYDSKESFETYFVSSSVSGPPLTRKRRCCCCWRSTFCMTAIILLSTALCLVLYFTSFVEESATALVYSQLAIRSGSKRTEDWAKGEPPLTYRFYVFNLTNVEDFVAGGRPHLMEVGPFTYRVFERKENHIFKDDYVEFNSRPLFVFLREESVGNPGNLMVNVLNVPLVNAGDMAKGNVLQKLLSLFRDTLALDSIQKLSIQELLWGHQSRLLDIAKKAGANVSYPFDYFALLAGRNDTLQPKTRINTGVKDIYKLGEVLSYDGPGPKTRCHSVKGTDGSSFGPAVNSNRALFIYNGQFCRSLPLEFKESLELQGLPALRFALPDDVFKYSFRSSQGPLVIDRSNRDASSSLNYLYVPEENSSNWKSAYGGDNHCFCNNNKCLPDGLLDMKPCLFGAAVAFSMPHFVNADPLLRHLVQGMRPDPAKHRTEFDIFPDLGVPLRVKLRMQMNVVLERNTAISRSRHYDLIYPIFWFEAGIDNLPEPIVQQLQMAQDLPPLMKSILIGITLTISSLFIVILFVHSIASLCSSVRRSLSGGSLPSGSSPQVSTSQESSRSVTPEMDPSRVDSTRHLYPNINYKSFSDHVHDSTYVPQFLDSMDGSKSKPMVTGRLMDTHTLLPPYRDHKPSAQVQTLRLEQSSNYGAEQEHSPSCDSDALDCNNAIPPTYHQVSTQKIPGTNEDVYETDSKSSSSSQSSAISVLAEVHHSESYEEMGSDGQMMSATQSTTMPPVNKLSGLKTVPSKPSYVSKQDDSVLLEHKPLLTSTITPESSSARPDTQNNFLRPLVEHAPLASPEDDKEFSEDVVPQRQTWKRPPVVIGVQKNNSLPLATSSPHDTLDSLNSSQVDSGIMINESRTNIASSMGSMLGLPPPLESDL